ncbi:MAG: peptidoglycan DD-metalloendopeptidase family protein [Phyllobacteriaceae bacterium]|nr:peptidoglycan DD-metalloendopeptidase family protein [Phyllobacteriaceae bacterium]
MIRLFCHILLVLLIANNLGGLAQAEIGRSADPTHDLRAVETELSRTTETQAALVRRMVDAIRAQEEASSKLVNLAATARQQEEALATAAKRLGKLQADNAKALIALAQKRESLSKLLAGLQRLEQNPPPALVVSPGDVLQALRGAMMFGAVIPDLRRDTEELRDALRDVEAIKMALEAEKQRAADALAALEVTRAEMATAVAERQKAATLIAAEISGEQEKSNILAAKAKTLKDLVATLEKAKAEEAKRLQRAAEEKARAEAEAETRARAEADVKAAAQAAAEAERLKALARPAMVFSQSLGKLDFPVQGSVWRGFGADTGLDGKTTGVFLLASARAQVLSPVDGIVEFAGQFHSYDQLVIINAGEGHLVLLAGMHEISAAQGQSVRAGEPVGIMGEKPAAMLLASDLNTAKAPVLYVEFRKKNEPIDPSPWWRAGRKEAMR